MRGKYKIDSNFFVMPSPEREWVLGFIYADGCIYEQNHRYNIVMTQKEPEILEKIKLLLKSDHPIKFYKRLDKRTNKYYTGNNIQIGNKKIYYDLINVGLHANKAFTILYPYNIVFHSHFIRGYFDGDGSIYKTQHKYPVVSIASSSKKFLIEMNKEISVEMRLERGTNIWRLVITKQSKIKIFAKIIYFNTYDGIRLDRKFKKLEEFI